MKQHVTLGIVCLVRETFDFAAAAEIYGDILNGVDSVENVTWVKETKAVISPDDAHAAGHRLALAGVDALVVVSGTFHLGHLALILKKYVDKPFLLWALDELPYNGGKIRLNSVCGVNLDASNLYKAGYDDVVAVAGGATVNEDFIDAVRMKKALGQAQIGILGYHAHGFFNLDTQALNLYNQPGAMVDHYEISDLTSSPVPDGEIAKYRNLYKQTFDVSGINERQLELTSALAARMAAFCDARSLSALAVRCWPEFARDYGVSPCAAMSLLQSSGYILACEGDMEGAISMLACKALGFTPFLADLSQIDFEKNFALLWHCGAAPSCLWDGASSRSLDTYFAGGKGVTADFVLKSGDIGLVRIDSARGATRLFLQSGTAVHMEKELRGTYAKAVFPVSVKDLFDRVTSTGIAHHLAMFYGNKTEAFRIFAKFMKYELI